MDYSKAVDRLIAKQQRDWDLAGRNYEALGKATTRVLQVAQSSIVLQFNPERRRSSAAAIDEASLGRRQCFLCTEHQPARQKAILWGGHYKIQVNPYPIFQRHLTIADLQHVPQRLAGRVDDMLQLASSLQDYVVFYNGPQCGASAPDHAHFQAAGKGEMPLCDEVLHATTCILADGDEGSIGLIDSLGRNLFSIETSTRRAAERYVLRLLDLLPVPQGESNRWSMCCAGGTASTACGTWSCLHGASIVLPAMAMATDNCCSVPRRPRWEAFGPCRVSRTTTTLHPVRYKPCTTSCV